MTAMEEKNGMSPRFSLVASALVLLLRIYQVLVSPLLHAFGASCRFHPSCSEYSRQSIMKHGVCLGFVRTLRRLSKCHPFHSGGFDPP